MKRSFDDLARDLKEKNIRLSHQRLKVLEYLTENPNHPTVDQIYTELHPEIPSLSKTTIYSTLNALAEAGLVRVITIEDNETRYDIRTEDHGHFKCEACGTIYDFGADIGSLKADDLTGFEVNDKHVYFKGICPQCHKNNN